jgi:hypothetical protein
MPAQLKTWFSLPYFWIMEAMKALHASLEPISKAEVKCSPASQRESVSEREEVLMSVRARVAPSWESLMLVARPIPEPAPVQRITVFTNCLAILKVEKLQITYTTLNFKKNESYHLRSPASRFEMRSKGGEN